MTPCAPAPNASPAAHPVLSFANPPGLYDPAPNGYSHLTIVQGDAAQFPPRTSGCAGVPSGRKWGAEEFMPAM